MSREITPESRAERPGENAIEGLGSQPKQDERQRGRWNFLTWSFFLAEVAAGAQFFATAAGAAQNADSAGRSKAHAEATDAIYDGVLGNLGSVVAATEDGSGAASSRTEAHSAEAGLNLLSLQQGDESGKSLSNTEAGGFAGALSSGSGTSGTGSSGGLQADSGGSPPISNEPPPGALPPVSPDPPSGGLPPISGDPPSGGLPPISDNPSGVLPPISVGGTVSLQLDIILDQLTGLHLVETVGGLLGDTLDDTLGQITGLVGNAGELVGDLLGSSLNAAFSATDLVPQAVGSVVSSVGTLGVVAPALDILSDAPEIAPLAHDQDVSSGGTISFPDLTSIKVLQVDDLFAGGRYTDYGLAVQSEVNSAATASADTLGGDTDNGTLNSPIDSPNDNHVSALSPGVQDLNASSVSLSSIIEDLGVRDLSI
jgi:hypothetical protein